MLSMKNTVSLRSPSVTLCLSVCRVIHVMLRPNRAEKLQLPNTNLPLVGCSHGFVTSFLLSTLASADFFVEIHRHPHTKTKAIAGAAAGRYCVHVDVSGSVDNLEDAPWGLGGHRKVQQVARINLTNTWVQDFPYASTTAARSGLGTIDRKLVAPAEMTFSTRSDVTTAERFVSSLFWKMVCPSARKTEQLVDTNISRFDDPVGTRSAGSDACIPTCA